MVRYQFQNAKILFIGINPHYGSYQRGVPFSNNKLFWYLLNRAGLIKENLKDLKDDSKLKIIYKSKFNKVYRLGLVNVINRPTRDITQLKRGEEKAGQMRIKKIVQAEKPEVVCFVGKVAYEKFSGLKKFDFGWQDDLAQSKVFVMHFPLHGKAEVRVRELEEAGRAAQLIK